MYFKYKDTDILKVTGWENMYYAINSNKFNQKYKKIGVSTLISKYIAEQRILSGLNFIS